MKTRKNSNIIFFLIMLNSLILLLLFGALKFVHKPKIFITQSKIVMHDDKDYYTIILNSAIKTEIDNKEIKIYLLTKKTELKIWAHLWLFDYYLVLDNVENFYNDEKVWLIYKEETYWEFIFSIK